jgi:pSer/pThr/pTyr-binding forkhead associated (FHA) protein
MNIAETSCPIIMAQGGPLEGQRWRLSSALIIGRDPDCDIIIPDRQVSRHHARLTLSSMGIELEDLTSKNGTYVKGKQIEQPIMLEDGDTLQVALVQKFNVLSSDITTPLEDFFQKASRGVSLDLRSRRVWVGKDEILPPLSVPQFRMLELLIDQAGKVVSRETVIIQVWGEQESAGVSEQALDALVRRLRERIHNLDPDWQYITSIRGHGLRFDNPT